MQIEGCLSLQHTSIARRPGQMKGAGGSRRGWGGGGGGGGGGRGGGGGGGRGPVTVDIVGCVMDRV